MAKLTHQMLRQIIKETLFIEAVDPDIDADPDDADMSEFVPGITKDKETRAYNQIIRWKDELLNLYKPGSQNAKNIIKTAPGLSTQKLKKAAKKQWDNRLRYVSPWDGSDTRYYDGDKGALDPAAFRRDYIQNERAQWQFDYKKEFYPKLQKVINFTFQSGVWPKSNDIEFLWSVKEEMPPGARGTVKDYDSWDKSEFIAQMRIDREWYFDPNTTDASRKNIIHHEIEHVISNFIYDNALQRPHSTELGHLDNDASYDAKDKFSGAHKGPGQRDLYKSIFSIDNVPKAFLDVINKETMKKIKDEIALKYSGQKLKKQKASELMWMASAKGLFFDGRTGSYYQRREEQRAFLKAYLAKNGGAMTSAMMQTLCAKKRELLSIDVANASVDGLEQAFSGHITNPSLPSIMILMLNCDDPEKTVGQLNQLVKSFSGGKPKTATV